MLAGDRLYIFKCGHCEWNPGFGRGKVRRCSKCRSGLRFIIRKCVDCQKWVLLKPSQGKQKRCKDCAVKKNREIQRRKKRDYRKRNKAHQRQTIKLYKPDVYMSLTDIAEYLGVSKERARQLECEAVTKFRKEWAKRHPDLPDPTLPDINNRKHHELNAE